MSESIYLLTISLFLGTVLLAFAIRYASIAFQARARLANDGAYRDLAERAASAQSANAATLFAIQSELSRVAATRAGVETILKQVG